MSLERRLPVSERQQTALELFAARLTEVERERWLYLSAILEGHDITQVAAWRVEGAELVVQVPEEAADAPAPA